MRHIQKNTDHISTLNHKWSVGRVGRMTIPKTLTIHMPRILSLAASVLILLVLVSSDWTVQAAMAARPALDLTLTGPQTAQAGQPLPGINISLVNPGPATQNARLRLFIQSEADIDLQIDDIKVAVQEGKSWIAVPLEPLDGGAMGAIGSEGSGHKERHARGGFAIPAKWNKLLQLQVTFRLPGVYKLVVAISPDNGETHLAQPSSITVEAQ